MREVLYGGEELEVSSSGRFVYLHHLNYQKIRIFYLSVLWRMSIASGDFFQDVDLGPHEDKIRNMLLKEEPGAPEQYGFLCVAPLFDDNSLGDWIVQPHCTRLEQHKVYRALFGGLLYLYFVSSHKVNKIIKERFIQKNGDWSIMIETIRNIDFLNKFLTELSEKQQFV
ncbi:MAG: hypothetical protein PHN82_11670 [bacterium]|nr:hypothetical protein [bacterium]